MVFTAGAILRRVSAQTGLACPVWVGGIAAFEERALLLWPCKEETRGGANSTFSSLEGGSW